MLDLTETVVWHSVAQLPDADITVLTWLDSGEWFSGFYDGEVWRDCTGVQMDNVLAWAEVNGPQMP